MIAFLLDHQWSDDSPFEYSKWAKDEPDNHKGAELCVEIDIKDGKKWTYRNCALVKNHVCKIKRG